MLTPIRCFSCGMSIGDIAPIYHFIRRERMGRRYGQAGGSVAAAQANIDPAQDENIMADVLDALGVTLCCRTHLVTAMLFCDHY